jgi:flagellar motor switch protein FliG
MLISVGEGIADFNGYIQLNETAAFIWEQLKKPRTLRELTEAVSAEYDISTEQAAGDVDDFISDLEKQNMVMIYE